MSKKRKTQKRLAQEWVPAIGFSHAFLATILELIDDGVIQSGKKSFSDTAVGFWMGIDTDGLAKLNIGDADNYLKFDGTDVLVAGDIEAGTITGTVAISGGEIVWAGGKGVADDSGISFTEDAQNKWDVGVTLGAMVAIEVDDPARGISVDHNSALGLAIYGAALSGGTGVQGRTTTGMGVNAIATSAGGTAVVANASGGGTSLQLAGGDMDAGSLKIENLADAAAATDALNRQTGDARYLQKASGWTGTFLNGDGDTVTVADGQITGVA